MRAAPILGPVTFAARSGLLFCLPITQASSGCYDVAGTITGTAHQCTYAHATCCESACTTAGGLWSEDCNSGLCDFDDCGQAPHSFVDPGHPRVEIQVTGCYDISTHECSHESGVCCEEKCTSAGENFYWSDQCVDERDGFSGCAETICPWEILHDPLGKGQAVSHNCECGCCFEGVGVGNIAGTKCTSYEYKYFNADTEAHCSAEMCSSKYSDCPDSGEHNTLSHVQATYQTCTCACCHPEDDNTANNPCGEFEYISFDAETHRHCSADMCSSKYSACPDSGEHNEGGVVEAMWLDNYMFMEAREPQMMTCECKCCHPDGSSNTCTNYEYRYFSADTPAHCSDEMCSSKYSDCPDSGEHNALAHVEATYHNCICACCHPDPDSGSKCNLFEFFVFEAHTQNHCSVAMCSSKYSACPDSGAHNELGVVEVMYIGAKAFETATREGDNDDADDDGESSVNGLAVAVIGVVAGVGVVIIGGVAYKAGERSGRKNTPFPCGSARDKDWVDFNDSVHLHRPNFSKATGGIPQAQAVPIDIAGDNKLVATLDQHAAQEGVTDTPAP